jgi:crotonobetainyl-CoA:carnitine CoA-transferase CaiB-like acyl-CoA transferase
VRAWIAERNSEEVIREFRRVDAAIAPVLDMSQIFLDPHYRAREMITEVDGVKMQNVIARLSKTPGKIRHVGRPFDADTDRVLANLPKTPRT